MSRLAAVLRCTTGQAWTLLLGFGLALLTLGAGLPPALRELPDTSLAAPTTERVDATTPTTTVRPAPGAAPASSAVIPPAAGGHQPRSAAPSAPVPFDSERATSVTPPSTQPPTRPSVAAEPPRVDAWAWASVDAGSPTAERDVPQNSLPIGAVVGHHTHRSFIRLAGTAETLRLPLVDDPRATRLPEFAEVVACPVDVARWDEGGGQSFADAPTYDCSNSVSVQVHDTFLVIDLRPLGAVPTTSGIALVPAPGASTFRISVSIDPRG